VSKAIDTLARTGWGEARGEGRDGMEAVMLVVYNRWLISQDRNMWWGNSIEEICLKPWQFSCWNKNDPNRDKLTEVTPDDLSFRIALELAEDILEGLPFGDITKGATHYYSPSLVKETPAWAEFETPTAVIGTHLFFRPREVTRLSNETDQKALFPQDTIYFPEQPDNRPVRSEGRKTIYKLKAPFAYIWTEYDRRRCILVPKGFENDTASVPWITWTASGMTPDGTHRAGAIIHDDIYEHHDKETGLSVLPVGEYLEEIAGLWTPVQREWTQEQADAMFKKIMGEYNVPKFRKWMAHKAVRLFGWLAWKT